MLIFVYKSRQTGDNRKIMQYWYFLTPSNVHFSNNIKSSCSSVTVFRFIFILPVGLKGAKQEVIERIKDRLFL